MPFTLLALLVATVLEAVAERAFHPRPERTERPRPDGGPGAGVH